MAVEVTFQWLLAHAGRIDQAVGELRRLTAANPNDLSAAFVQASALLHADRNAEAAEVLGALVRRAADPWMDDPFRKRR